MMQKISKEDLTTVRTYNNLVLILPDKDYETYQRGGKDTGIYAATIATNAGENVSVKGTVYAVPDSLTFNGREILSLQYDMRDAAEGTERQEYMQKKVDQLKESSVLYDVPIEIVPGDRVSFFYRNHFDAMKKGMTVDTELGEMILMKYDTLAYTLDENNKFLKMLNGYLLVEMMEPAMKTKAGIHLIDYDAHTHFTKKPKKAYGKIIAYGCMCNGYVEALGVRDGKHFEYDKPIMYNPRYARIMEHDLHQDVFDKAYQRIHRKDVFGFMQGDDILTEISNFKPY